MSWLKQSAFAVAAWQISSVVTLFQMSVAKVTMPDEYNWIMDTVGSVVVPTWQFICQYAGVVWEFLNSS